MRVRILTGRRHQIRRHLACIGHPVCGDPLYRKLADLPPLAQHHKKTPQAIRDRCPPALLHTLARMAYKCVFEAGAFHSNGAINHTGRCCLLFFFCAWLRNAWLGELRSPHLYNPAQALGPEGVLEGGVSTKKCRRTGG